MTGRVGRDKFRRDYPSRSEEKSGRSNPPSRHLWVGNISQSVSESTLTNHFLHFGKLESVAFQLGRSYAFINFINEEGAFAAMRELEGYVLAGSALRIQFAKAEKSLPSRDDDYLQRRDEPRSNVRASPFPQRDSRSRHHSPEPYYPDKSKMSDRDVEPSEVLWIGFPAQLKVDETILRRAFSPFGEIEKITVFPGRSYAFVRFRNVMGACRAKETLQGKLFGNPRVHICFARNDSGSSSNTGRNSMPPPSLTRNSMPPPSLHMRSYGLHDRDLDEEPNMRSPRFMSNIESVGPEAMNFKRKGEFRGGGDGAFEQRRFQELGPEQGLYERHGSPPGNRGAHFRDFSPERFPPPRQGPFYDDSWDLPEDALLYHGAKKPKNTPFPPDNELPEFPYSDTEQAKHVRPRMLPDLPQPQAGLDRNFDSGSFGYNKKQTPDRVMPPPPPPPNHPYGERIDHRAVAYDGLQVGLPPKPVEWKRSTPDPPHSSLNEEWKWEGTLAKGGNPVCRVRCFPVGKVMDMVLPDYLDCTARTGLEMLAKHYYQAANAWVVFFVPHSDPDIVFYNEFMSYLTEKQRAAVAKLDEVTTLFLVPPSDFSEKVLKVPGKLSISGVILKLDYAGSNHGNPHERVNNNTLSTSPSGPYSSAPPGPYPGKPRMNNPPFQSNLSSSHTYPDYMDENSHEYVFHQRNSNNHLQNPNSGTRNVGLSNSGGDHMFQGYNPAMPRAVQETSSSSYGDGILGSTFAGSGRSSFHENSSSPMPVAASLQPEQLAKLASSLLGQQQRQQQPMGEDFRQNPSENLYRTSSQNYSLPHNQAYSEHSSSQFGQVQQMQQQQQQMSNAGHNQRDMQIGSSGSQQQEEEGDADPQKRLQATLQLAAALLQQIQQGKGT